MSSIVATGGVIIEVTGARGPGLSLEQLALIDSIEPSIEAISGEVIKYAKIVATYAERDGEIPAIDRPNGLMRKVMEAGASGQWFAWNTATSAWETPFEFTDNIVVFASPPIIDQGVCYFPSFRVFRYGQNGLGDFYTPATGSVFVSPASTTSETRRHVFDRTTGLVSEVSGNDLPLVDNLTQVVLAVSTDSKIVDNKGRPFVGDVPGGAVANQYYYGKNVDAAPFRYPGNTGVNIADADLLALGFTRGLRSVANSFATMGGYLAEPPEVGDFICARFYLHTTVAGQFGQARLFLYENEQTADFVIPTVFREISATVREYFYSGRVTHANRLKWAVGTDNQANASLVTITGVQFHVGPDPAYWISRNDYPDAPGLTGADPLLADKIYMVTDRALPFFPANALARRNLPAKAEIYTTPPLATPADPAHFGGAASDRYELDHATLSDNLFVEVRSSDAADHLIYTRSIPIIKRAVPLVTPVTKNVLYLGDSHSNGLFSIYLKARAAQCGVTINFQGTLPNDAGQVAEGRGGWSLANIIGTRQGAAWTSVVGPGEAATLAYLAGDYTYRLNAQPFLNNGTSGSAAPIISGGIADGYRFDLVNYRDRFELPTIDFVLLNLWSNDMNLLPRSAGLADIVALYPVMLAEIRRAFPTAKIIVWAAAPGIVNQGDLRWNDRLPALQAVVSAVRTAIAGGDTNLHLCGAWMHHTVRSGYTLSAGTLQTSGALERTMIDEVHANHPGNAQIAEAVAAAIINLI